MADSELKIENELMLAKMQNRMLAELETRIEKHLKSEFYNKILPRVMNDVKNYVTIEAIEQGDFLEFKLQINRKD